MPLLKPLLLVAHLLSFIVDFFPVADILFIEIEVIEYFIIATHGSIPAFIMVLADPFCRVNKVIILLSLLLLLLLLLLLNT